MSDPMIGGEERRPGGSRPDTTDAWITIDRDDVVLVPGFGLLPNVAVDQHFLRRRRHNRLISVVLERPTVIGVGIDESTALVVPNDAAPGSYEVAWDGFDAAGQSLSPGVYHYRVVPQGATVAVAVQGTLSGMTPTADGGVVYHLGDAIVRADDLVTVG